MKENSLLFARRLPARLDVEQVSEITGFLPLEVRILTRLKVLPVLGQPAQNAHKYYARVVIEDLCQDAAWLDKATKAISKYWRQNNAKQSERSLTE